MRTRLAVAVSGLALVAIAASGAGAATLSPAHLAPAQAAAAGPRVTLSPASGPPTTTVAVSGSGFGAYEGVDLYFGTTDLALAGTGRTGSFGPVSIHIPASAIPGTAWVSAEGRRTRLFAQTPFTVRTNWDQFHFSANHEGVNPYENVLSPATVTGLDVNWIFATGNLVSSPAVVNGLVYITSYDDSVYAVNASTGA
jgi:outer membrane protein assembly factor BamB